MGCCLSMPVDGSQGDGYSEVRINRSSRNGTARLYFSSSAWAVQYVCMYECMYGHHI